MMGISRPKVSRLLTEGRQLNIVQIVIQDPGTSIASNEEKIKSHYKLDLVKIVPTQHSPAATMTLIGRAASAFLNENIQEDSCIGITWGNTTISRGLLIAFACRIVESVHLSYFALYKTLNNIYIAPIIEQMCNKFLN